MIYAMEKSIESLSKPKWWTTIVAVGSLAVSPFVGSCSAEYQSPKPAPEASTTAAAASTAPGELTYEGLADEIGKGNPVWIAPVAYMDSADDASSGDIVVRPVVEVNGDPTCQQPGESRQVGSAQVEYYAVKDGQLTKVDAPSAEVATRSDSFDQNTATCVQFSRSVDGYQPGVEVPTHMVIDGSTYNVMQVVSAENSSTPRQALDPIDK
jgi:hypothetical protein